MSHHHSHNHSTGIDLSARPQIWIRLILSLVLLIIVSIGISLTVEPNIPRLLIGELSAEQLVGSDQKYYLARIKETRKVEDVQKLTIELLSGSEKGKVLEVDNDLVNLVGSESRELALNEFIVVLEAPMNGQETDFFVYEQFRLPALLWVLLAFIFLTIIFAGTKGVGSLLGLSFSILILSNYVVPEILKGRNPLLVSLTGALIIAFVALYLAHGFNKRTTIALISTLITITLTLLMSLVFVNSTLLFGTGSEDATYLRLANVGTISLQGLLLGGIVIGALGVLDDITTAQVAVVEELKLANSELSIKELYRRGISVGKEHITSLVNTLVLAYAGAALPLLVLFTVNNQIPLWVTLNSELVAEEVVRTLVGSMSLILAVPITTLLAAWYYGRK